jgi:hypothetical protein
MTCAAKRSTGVAALVEEADSCGCNGHDHDEVRRGPPPIGFQRHAERVAYLKAVTGEGSRSARPGSCMISRPAGDPVNATPSTAQYATQTALDIVHTGADLGRTAIDAETQRQQTAADVEIARIQEQGRNERARILAEAGLTANDDGTAKDPPNTVDTSGLTALQQQALAAQQAAAAANQTPAKSDNTMLYLGLAVLAVVVIGGVVYYVMQNGKRVRAPRSRQLARNPRRAKYGTRGSRYAQARGY